MGFKFVQKFWDFPGDKLNNTNIIMEYINFHVEDVKDSKKFGFSGYSSVIWPDTTCRLPNASIRTHLGFNHN